MAEETIADKLKASAADPLERAKLFAVITG